MAAGISIKGGLSPLRRSMPYVNTVISEGQEKKGALTPALSQGYRPGGGALFEDPAPFFSSPSQGGECERMGGLRGDVPSVHCGTRSGTRSPFLTLSGVFLIRSPNQK